MIKAFYIYNGIGMEYMDLGSEYQVGYIMKELTNSYKKGNLITIRADREICIIMNDDAELVSVDVWAVNDAADMENIAPELIASGLSEAEFLDFVSSGEMQFRPNSEDGTALPCFAVFTAKKVCSYIEVTGEYEVLYESSIIPFISEGAHKADTVRLIRYNFSGDGVGIKEILPCDLADSLIRLLRNAKKTNIAVSAISDEPVNEFSETLPVAPGTLWIEIGSSIYRIDPDMTELCKVSSHLGEGELLELSGLLPVYLQQAWYYYPYDYYVEEYNCSTGISHINHTYTADTSIDIFHVVFDYAGSLRASGNLIVNIISDKDQTLTVRLECEKSEDMPGGGDSKEVSFKAGWQTEVYLAYEGWDDGPFWIYVTCDNTKYAVKVIP
ncbi:MAG: hypothetical protein J5950_04310 [Clostridia bacterium]|nr:hypothetical protein [Clostridia bacterium]